METRIFDPSVIFSTIPALLPFLSVTLGVAFSSVILGSLLGLLLAWAKLGKNKVLRSLAHAYTYIMRCTPSIVLLFIVFYGLPKFTYEYLDYDINDISRAYFTILTFVLLFGAYISEVFRAAISAVPKGQYEAAVSVGLSPIKAMRHVVLPQAALIALPNFGNALINLMKEGALAYTIGLVDLLGKGNLIIAQNYGAYGIEIYLACLLIYWAMTSLTGWGIRRLEEHLNKGGTLAVKKERAPQKAALFHKVQKKWAELTL